MFCSFRSSTKTIPRSRSSLSPRSGFTLVELLVVIGIIGVLVAMLIPAVQMVREAGRRVDCANRLKNQALAVYSYESGHQELPGSWFNAAVDSPEYSSDRGLFFWLLPFMELNPLSDQISQFPFLVATRNQEFIAESPAVFLCPSGFQPTRLQNVSSRFNGPPVEGLEVSTCDYVGNGGFFDEEIMRRSSEWKGFFPIRMDGVARATRIRSITDGTSNTTMMWESSGGVLRLPNSNSNLDLNTYPLAGFNLIIDAQSQRVFRGSGLSNAKTYVRSWLGLRMGGVFGYANDGSRGSPLQSSEFQRVINVTNLENGLFSNHPDGCNVARADGSVSFLVESMDAQVLYSSASRSGGETDQW